MILRATLIRRSNGCSGESRVAVRLEICWDDDGIFINQGLHYYNEHEWDFLRIIYARGLRELRNARFEYITLEGDSINDC